MSDVKELRINNVTYDIKAKSVVDTNSGSVKYWTGTKAQYDAIVTKDSTTVYFLTDTGNIYFGSTLISNKGADVDFSNVTDTADILMAHNAMPSTTTTNLTLGASDTSYTAIADGYVFLAASATAAGQYIYIGNNQMTIAMPAGVIGNLLQIYFPVGKGQSYTVGWTTSTPIVFRFVYAVGSESEAS